MRPRLRVHFPLKFFLNAVVANRCGGIEAVCDVLIRQLCQVAGLGGMIRPNTGIAVRLQLNAHGCALWPGAVIANLGENPLHILHMMTVLVCEDVFLRERSTIRTELRVQLIEETEINIHDFVIRAVERANI